MHDMWKMLAEEDLKEAERQKKEETPPKTASRHQDRQSLDPMPEQYTSQQSMGKSGNSKRKSSSSHRDRLPKVTRYEIGSSPTGPISEITRRCKSKALTSVC